MKYKYSKLKHLDYVLVIAFSYTLFSCLISDYHSDIGLHIGVAIEAKESGSYSANFLYYCLLNLLTFSSIDETLYRFVAVGILTVSTFLKYYISKLFVTSELIGLKVKGSFVVLLTLMLFFCFSIPDWYSVCVLEFWYLGRAVPFVLHNSTTIFVFPFVLLLFIKQLELFNNSKITYRALFIVLILILLNATAKPSFLISYLPITGLMILWRYYKREFSTSQFLLLSSPLFIGGMLLALEVLLIYHFQMDGSGPTHKQESSIGLSWLHVITHFIPSWYIPITLLMSFLFPLALMISYKDLLKYQLFTYAVSLFLLGYLVMLTIYETGPRQFHGNFFWQIYLCSYLVFMTSTTFFARKCAIHGLTLKNICLFLLLCLHSCAGVGYIGKFLITGSYY